jgi:hypothetical protein
LIDLSNALEPPQVLLEHLEEQLDLPASLVDRGNGAGAEAVVVGQECQYVPCVIADGLDAAQEMRAFSLCSRASHTDGLILENAQVLQRFALIDHLELDIVLHAGNQKHA